VVPEKYTVSVTATRRDGRDSRGHEGNDGTRARWGVDPEANNFGNNNVGRFVDLAPFPPARQFFFSVDLGF